MITKLDRKSVVPVVGLPQFPPGIYTLEAAGRDPEQRGAPVRYAVCALGSPVIFDGTQAAWYGPRLADYHLGTCEVRVVERIDGERRSRLLGRFRRRDGRVFWEEE